MNARDILADWLKSHGYDGLWHDSDCDCGCVLDDLMPCCSDPSLCEPGYRLPGDEDSPYYVGPCRVPAVQEEE